MELHLLMWKFFTFIMVTGCVTEFCVSPPDVRHATFKALTYKTGTLLNCECKKGFRRKINQSAFMNCTGAAGHSSWENQCQCVRTSPRGTDKQATPKPEEQKERKTTEMQNQMHPTDQVNLLGHCREPPPWEHEASGRIYHFVVGQRVHYECAQGFRALQRGTAESICKMIRGAMRWTQPKLKCTSESDEESQTSMDTPSGSETPWPLITAGTTTDFKKHTEVDTPTEMFIFTTEYQIAVASCVLLLISILLLSAFTWQQRWRKSRRTI